MNRPRKIIALSVQQRDGKLTDYYVVADDGTVWYGADSGIFRPDVSEWRQVILPPLPEI